MNTKNGEITFENLPKESDSPKPEDFDAYLKVLVDACGNEELARVMLSLTPSIMEGRPWGIVDPDVMREAEFLEVGNLMNSNSSIPVKLFQLKDGWGLLWGYDFEKTTDWYFERLKELEEAGVKCETLLWHNFEDLKEVVERSRLVEATKFGNLEPKDGDILGLFNVSDEYSVIVDKESYPQWGLSLTDLKDGVVKPKGMDLGVFEENKLNITFLLRETPVSAMGESLLFEWV